MRLQVLSLSLLLLPALQLLLLLVASVAAITNAAPGEYYNCKYHMIKVIPLFVGLFTFVVCCVGVVVIVVYTMVL